MIAAFDVQYDDSQSHGAAAGVVFEHWNDATATAEYCLIVENVAAYVPGLFFHRELPCLMAVITRIKESIDVIIVDSYVDLDQGPGMRRHLYEKMDRRVPVIGVAKTKYFRAVSVEIVRGESQSPLYITSAGIDLEEAATCISRMHGRFRMPTLLKRVDQLARSKIIGNVGSAYGKIIGSSRI